MQEVFSYLLTTTQANANEMFNFTDTDPNKMNECFRAFDKDEDQFLNKEEFERVCKALFRNDEGIVYDLKPEMVNNIFEIFDTNHDNLIDLEEFGVCWNKWIKVIVRPVSALLIVDVQNDFICGNLNISNCAAQHNGLEVVEPINRLLDTVQFDAVFYSLDWHPSNHVSFIDNLSLRKLDSSSPISAEEAKVCDSVIFEGPPLMEQKLWPRHCVQDSWGAELHKDLKIPDNAIKICKGTNSEVDSYSVFWDNMKLKQTMLSTQLRERNITDIFICGIAYDVCVGATVADSLSAGYRTILLDDCCRGTDLNEIEKTKNGVLNRHGIVTNSDQVQAMVEGRDRRPELAYKLALELKKELGN